ncbi:MAG: hypothetical protein ABI696_17820, partial [Rubrivivax sp.]
MADPKDGDTFFRKVVRFVANPTTDWHELNSRPGEARENELEKSELKAMIERKRRNDFVRKREFDMLRKVRREGLTPEQLAALGGSSRLDDSEARMAEGKAVRPGGVKAKIDAIEQQMVGDSFRASTTTAPGAGAAAPTVPAGLGASGRASPGGRAPASRSGANSRGDSTPPRLPTLAPLPELDSRPPRRLPPAPSPAAAPVTM